MIGLAAGMGVLGRGVAACAVGLLPELGRLIIVLRERSGGLRCCRPGLQLALIGWRGQSNVFFEVGHGFRTSHRPRSGMGGFERACHCGSDVEYLVPRL
jgi:hypothetical protein